jgi:two-component system LytT family response regulator
MTNEVINVMIVEDMEDARHSLEHLLSSFPFINIVASVANIRDAEIAFLQHKPTLIFLDVELPDKTGFEFLEDIGPIANDLTIIFATSFDYYAIQAIKHSAFDYLLKPIDPLELSLTLEKLRKNIEQDNFQANLTKLVSSLQPARPLKLNSKNGFVLVNPENIMYCEADWNYTHIFLADGRKILITQNLGTLAERLEGDCFIRINRSNLINTNYLQHVDKKKLICLLKSDVVEYPLIISSSKAKLLDKTLISNEL